MYLVRRTCGKTIEEEYFFEDRHLAVKQTEICLEKESEIYCYDSCQKDIDGFYEHDEPSIAEITEGLSNFEKGLYTRILFSGLGSDLFEIDHVDLKEIKISHAVCQPMIEVEGYMCSEPWDV